ncbi:MAG TPA: RidA family protein [Bordetella sp.]|nr:RidA family protein [Bordetella sp.]
MGNSLAASVASLGLVLPQPAVPRASYEPWVKVGKTLYISGQVAKHNDEYPYVGRLGRELDVEAGRAAARLCALAILAQLDAAISGDLRRLQRCVRLTGYVNATPEFVEHPRVIDGASELIVQVLGEAGRHARTAVGLSSLPRGVAVEVEAIFELSE